MQITDKQLRLIMPHASPMRISTHLAPLNAAMEEFEISTRARVRMFLAQLAHESGELRYFEEIASGDAYDNRIDLGNTLAEAIAIAAAHGTTPGRFWKGHGPIQITGYKNHCAARDALGIDCVNTPSLLTTLEHAFRGAGWFWRSNGLNDLADADAFLAISRAINLGNPNSPHMPNHETEREAYLALAERAIP